MLGYSPNFTRNMASLQASVFLTYLIGKLKNGIVEDTVEEALKDTALIETRQLSAIKRCEKHKIITKVSMQGTKRTIALDTAQIALYQTPKSVKEPKQSKAKGAKLGKKASVSIEAPEAAVA